MSIGSIIDKISVYYEHEGKNIQPRLVEKLSCKRESWEFLSIKNIEINFVSCVTVCPDSTYVQGQR